MKKNYFLFCNWFCLFFFLGGGVSNLTVKQFSTPRLFLSFKDVSDSRGWRSVRYSNKLIWCLNATEYFKSLLKSRLGQIFAGIPVPKDTVDDWTCFLKSLRRQCWCRDLYFFEDLDTAGWFSLVTAGYKNRSVS